VSPPAAPPRQAHGVLAPALFGLVTEVRQASARVAARSDPEAIHDFRVALRRLRTLLRPARRAFGKRRLKEIGGELRRFAQVTGALRDEEVLRETLTALELPPKPRVELAAWLVQRARQERVRRRGVVTVLRAAEAPGGEPSLGTALAHLERRLGRGRRRDEEGLSAEALATEAVSGAFAAVRELAGADLRDSAAMHELRIRFKRLRYTAELFAPILGERGPTVAKSAARLQKRLGELHDVDEALIRISRARGLSDVAVGSLRRALGRARAARCERARKDLASELTRLEGELGR
jgi:CHAD domain-containing protein